jgi:hypothetical protein
MGPHPGNAFIAERRVPQVSTLRPGKPQSNPKEPLIKSLF